APITATTLFAPCPGATRAADSRKASACRALKQRFISDPSIVGPEGVRLVQDGACTDALWDLLRRNELPAERDRHSNSPGPIGTSGYGVQRDDATCQVGGPWGA